MKARQCFDSKSEFDFTSQIYIYARTICTRTFAVVDAPKFDAMTQNHASLCYHSISMYIDKAYPQRGHRFCRPYDEVRRGVTE